MRKSSIKKITAALLSIFVAFTFMVVPQTDTVFAAESYPCITHKYAKSINVLYGDTHMINMGNRLKGAKKIKVTSGNSKVIEVINDNFYFKDGVVPFTAHKAGTATIKIKVTKKGKTSTYKCKVKAVKWNNPFRTAKIGTHSLMDYFNERSLNAGHGVDVYDDKVTEKIAFKAAKGWTIKKIQLETIKFNSSNTKIISDTKKTVKNNSNVSFHIGETRVQRLVVTMRNKSKGITEKFNIIITFGLSND